MIVFIFYAASNHFKWWHFDQCESVYYVRVNKLYNNESECRTRDAIGN